MGMMEELKRSLSPEAFSELVSEIRSGISGMVSEGIGGTMQGPEALGDLGASAYGWMVPGNQRRENPIDTMEEIPLLGQMAGPVRMLGEGGRGFSKELLKQDTERGGSPQTFELGEDVMRAADVAMAGHAVGVSPRGARPPRNRLDDVVPGVRRRMEESHGPPLSARGDDLRRAEGEEYWGEVADGVYADDVPTPENLLATERMNARQAELKPAVGTYTDDAVAGVEPHVRSAREADELPAFESLDSTLQDMVMNKEISLDEALDLDGIAETKHMIMQEEAENCARRQGRMDISKESSGPALTQQRGLSMDQAFQNLLDQGFDEETALRMLLDG